ncbi:capsid protein [Companilactobacillus zhachilii]|uniref:Capsid protein n=1 Tax=Companilactobacillus zhachilii TaxID=2304606 RepID=A0A386PS13_9LACO|nr:phage scaffolding protein [Companilactobacillus zhachilii]AYE37493.1 capsid protein [Companilactobacillus zhachilii]
MKREFLKDLGLTDEVIEKVMTEYGKDVQDSNSKLALAEQERDSLKSQSKTKSEVLTKKANNSDDLNNQIENLQSTIKENDESAASNLLQVKQDNAVNNYLKDTRIRNLIMYT